PLAEWAAEAIPEIPELHAGHMLDQSQQVGAGRHHRAADVVLREPIELPQQGFACVLQIAVKVRFRIRSGHADSLPSQLRRLKISADRIWFWELAGPRTEAPRDQDG